MDLRDHIRDIPDFPIPGVLFRDITPLLRSPDALKYVVDEFTRICRDTRVDAVVGIESRGFLFGTPLAYNLGVPFVPVRKPGNLPAARMSIEYSLEYGTNRLDIHEDALAPGEHVVIVDDLLATGGTARATAKLCELIGGVIERFLFVIELSFLDGRRQLGDYQATTLVTY
jgi:adenine phosphoribosyltransferase